jgi:hypothetical protein
MPALVLDAARSLERVRLRIKGSFRSTGLGTEAHARPRRCCPCISSNEAIVRTRPE